MKLTPEAFRGLVRAIREARYEACLYNGCNCVTDDEHQRMLASRPPSVEKNGGVDSEKGLTR